jgi:hypothetical protein
MKRMSRLMGEKVWFGALAVGMLLVPQGAFAVVPIVKTVPWVAANSSVPHDTYAGKTITLKGTSDQAAGNFKFDWNFGDGSVHATGIVTNQYDVEATHAYVGPVGTIWSATLTITDTNTNDSASNTYMIEMRDNNLQSNVNVAIDEGLWYLHKTMARYVSGPHNVGDWFSCSGFACSSAWGLTATNVQAFEVNGHLESGPASDPYTDDVARGLKAVFANLQTFTISSFQVSGGCASPPCNLNPDGNGNGIATQVAGGSPNYQTGMAIDAIVASGTPGAVTVTGPAGVIGMTYKTVVQDMVDQYAFCIVRGNTGGGWRYGCPDGVGDGSVSQWAAIGLIAAQRGFGSVVDPTVFNWNKVWLVNSQDSTSGEFGYTNPFPVWGPYATTPSGMVQMAMDQIGRGNTQWDKAESFIRDNFGNAPINNNVSLKAYYYGMFSFTKSMLLHDPGGVLTPITLLRSTTAGVNPIDWYAAEASKGDPTDGVARWLVTQQNSAGYWYNQLEINTASQWPFSTGFAIIMLRRTVFTACITDLGGKGTPSGRAAARVDLTWSAVTGADHYIILRGTVTGGPYTPLGTSTVPAFSDNSGLVNGNTYFYVVQPATKAGGAICQSNEAAVKVPVGR